MKDTVSPFFNSYSIRTLSLQPLCKYMSFIPKLQYHFGWKPPFRMLSLFPVFFPNVFRPYSPKTVPYNPPQRLHIPAGGLLATTSLRFPAPFARLPRVHRQGPAPHYTAARTARQASFYGTPAEALNCGSAAPSLPRNNQGDTRPLTAPQQSAYPHWSEDHVEIPLPPHMPCDGRQSIRQISETPRIPNARLSSALHIRLCFG